MVNGCNTVPAQEMAGIMIQLGRDGRSLSGLEAAIILIAVVFISTMFLYLVFGA